MKRIQVYTPRLLWAEIKAQAERENTSAQKLASRSFELYLSTIKAQ